MNNKSVSDLLYGVGETTFAYLPNLLGGLLLMAIGLMIGWVVKRVVIQACVILHVERLLRRFRGGSGFSKADVRYALFDWIGGFAGFVVFLVFLNAALDSMRLTVLSNLIEQGVWFIPKLLITLVIFGLGLLFANVVASALFRSLRREEVPRASLIARFAKMVVTLFFSAMALSELDISRQIVVIGFAATIVTLCLLMLILVVMSGRDFAKRIIGKFDDEES